MHLFLRRDGGVDSFFIFFLELNIAKKKKKKGTKVSYQDHVVFWLLVFVLWDWNWLTNNFYLWVLSAYLQQLSTIWQICFDFRMSSSCWISSCELEFCREVVIARRYIIWRHHDLMSKLKPWPLYTLELRYKRQRLLGFFMVKTPPGFGNRAMKLIIGALIIIVYRPLWQSHQYTDTTSSPSPYT